jgi:hypothetical protein
MSHRIELKGNLAIVQFATPSSPTGKQFQLLDESGDTTEIILNSFDLEAILHKAELVQNA